MTFTPRATLHVSTDSSEIRVRYAEGIDRIAVSIGYDTVIHLADKDSAHALIDKLQDAVREQARHADTDEHLIPPNVPVGQSGTVTAESRRD